MDSAVTTERSKTTLEKNSVFRGTWQPTLYKPVFGAYQFLPTPLPQEPRRKPVEEEKPKEEEIVETPKPDTVKERLTRKWKGSKVKLDQSTDNHLRSSR